MTDDTIFLSSADKTPTAAAMKAAADDEAWFAKHPTRRFRIRRVRKDEFPNPDGTHALVAHLGPSVIWRSNFVGTGGRLPNTDLQGECIWQRWGYAPLSERYGLQVHLMNAEARGQA